MLNGFKERLNAPNGKTPQSASIDRQCAGKTNFGDGSSNTFVSVAAQSTTPTGTPPQVSSALLGSAHPGAAAAAAAPQDTSSILANLQALANLSKNNSAGPAGVPGQNAHTSNVSFPQAAFPQNVQSAVNPASSMQPAPQAVSAPTPVNNGVYSYGGGFPQNLFPSGQANQAPQQPAMPQNGAGGGAPDALQQQLSILSALKQQGIPESQWPALLSVLMAGANPVAAANQAQPTNVGGGRDDASRDHRNGYDQYVRSPPGGRYGDRARSRSRSPRGWDRRRDNSPRRGRRDSPVYGEYGAGRDRDHDRDRDHGRKGGRGGDRQNRGDRFNRRSPDRFRRSPSPRHDQLPAPGPKWVEYDNTLPKGTIKGESYFFDAVEDECLHHLQSTVGLCSSVESRKHPTSRCV